jgi:high-affinity iron transporter
MKKCLGKLALALAAWLALNGSSVAAVSDEVRTTWRLIDYMAVDYAGAVEDGVVVSEFEYAEMQEFANTIRERIAALPAEPDSSPLLAQADALVRQVDARAPAATVRETARGLGRALLALHPVPTAPEAPPDLARGAVLYQQLCTSCHGASGQGDGPAAEGMEPAPIDFTDAERARERSVFALYQVTLQGLEGTPMIGYGHLPDSDQWALAFYVSTLAFPETAAEAGKRRWESDPELRAELPGLDALVQASPVALSEPFGADAAHDVMAYLRRNPGAVEAADAGRLDLARSQLAASTTAYRAGDRDEARRLALSAYLDGFEPLEPLLATHGDLLGRVEGAMNAYRAAIARGAPAEDLSARSADIGRLFDEVESVLDEADTGFASALLGAAMILLREGLEAMLLVVAMVAFLRKAGREDVMPYVHAGWVGALAAGVLTWIAATTLISIGGASRELTEGIGGVLAAVVLLTVGLWMHHKSFAGRWQQYIRDKLSKALTKRSAWALAVLTFVVVYREVFETILFYAALWGQAGGRPVLGGLLAGGALLAVIGWLLLRASRKLPIGTFFAWSSALIAVLAFVLAGKGVAGLQEAGVLSVTPIGGPRVVWLGIFPTLEGLGAQALVLVILVAGFVYNRISAAAVATPT